MTTLKNLTCRTLLLASAGLALAVIPAFAQNAEQQPETFQRSFALSSGGTLRVDNYKGTIHVTGADSNQVAVDVVKRFEGSEADRKEWMRETRVDFRNDNNRVEIDVHYPTTSWSCWFCWGEHDYSAAVELEIKVPRHTSVEIESYKSDVKISSLQGDLRIHSYKSPMNIESTTGGVRIDTYKDEINLHKVNIRGALVVKSYKADATIEATSLGDSAELENERGSIVVRVPANIGLDVDFDGARRSSFHTDFPVASQTGGRWDHSVRGAINQGGTRLRLRTTRGSVSLEKLSGQL
jgi:hypothetical protein